MPVNYQLAKIYCIRNSKGGDKMVYIGSTVRPLSECMHGHRCKVDTREDKNKGIYKLLCQVGVEHFHIELISNFPCNSCEELNAEKGRIIRLNNMTVEGCNTRNAGRSHKESVKAYLDTHKEEIDEYRNQYIVDHKEEITTKLKEYRDAPEHKQKMQAYMKQYRADNKIEIAKKKKAYEAAKKASLSESG